MKQRLISFNTLGRVCRFYYWSYRDGGFAACSNDGSSNINHCCVRKCQIWKKLQKPKEEQNEPRKERI